LTAGYPEGNIYPVCQLALFTTLVVPIQNLLPPQGRGWFSYTSYNPPFISACVSRAGKARGWDVSNAQPLLAGYGK